MNVLETAPSQVKGTLDLIGAPLESQTHQQAGSQAISQKSNDSSLVCGLLINTNNKEFILVILQGVVLHSVSN